MNLKSQNKNQYAVLDFEQINEKGLKPLITAINKGTGPDIASVEASNKAVKKDGIPTKTAVLRFDDQQELKMLVNDTGDISTLTLNGKKVPVPEAKTITALGKAISGAAVQAAPAFAKSMTKKLQAVMRKAADRPAVKSNIQRLQEAKTTAGVAQANVDVLKTAMGKEQTRQAQTLTQVSQEKARLESERAITRTLKEKIANLEAQNV